MIEVLTEKLSRLSYFSDLVYIEGRHNVIQTSEQYLGVWWSVNDIRSQAGEEIFVRFMEYVKKRIKGMKNIETCYLTRAWSIKKV